MNRLSQITAALGCLLLVAVPVLAQDGLAKRVSLDLKAMAPADAFKVIADAIGYTVDVKADVSTPVDILVRNITAKTALNTICESIGCTWKTAGTVLSVSSSPSLLQFAVRVRPGERATPAQQSGGLVEMKSATVRAGELAAKLKQNLPPDMKFENAPLTEVAERLSKATGLQITVSGDTPPGQTFSADLGNRPFMAALRALSEQLQGNVICRIGLRKGPGDKEPAIVLDIQRVERKVVK